MPLDLSCIDWWPMLQAGQTPMADVPVNEDAARQAVGLFNKLCLPDVPGQPTFGEVGAPWCTDIVRALFGALGEDGKSRLVKELFLLIPKKNSKTTNSAAKGVLWLCLNTTHMQTGMIVAPTQSIAQTCFNRAVGMIKADPDLRDLFDIKAHQNKIVHRITESELQIKTFAMDVLTGGIPAFTILDELHLMSSKTYAEEVLGQIRGGMITNPMALLIIITTQSTNPPAGVFKSELEAARQIRDGKLDAHGVLPVLYEFPESMQIAEDQPWRSQDAWPAVLPNLNRSINVELLNEDYEKSMARGDTSEQLWFSQHLNIQVGLGMHDGRWIGADYWQACAESRFDLYELIERSEVVTVGFDGGGLDDLAGLAVFGRCAQTRQWLAWFHAWAQPDVFERRKEIASTLRDFVDQGDLTLCKADNPQQDFEEAAAFVAAINDAGKMPAEHAVGLDAYGVSDLVDMLIENGLDEDQIGYVPQGFKLSSAIWGMERKLKDGMLRHAGSPMMNWVLGNAKAEQRGNNVYITKSAAGKAKIDPLVAGFNAYSLMVRNPVVSHGSYLDREELVVL